MRHTKTGIGGGRASPKILFKKREECIMKREKIIEEVTFPINPNQNRPKSKT